MLTGLSPVCPAMFRGVRPNCPAMFRGVRPNCPAMFRGVRPNCRAKFRGVKPACHAICTGAQLVLQCSQVEQGGGLIHCCCIQGLETAQSSAAVWEAQAQENLHQAEQLKSLLEESAFWDSAPESASPDLAARQQGSPPKGEPFLGQWREADQSTVTCLRKALFIHMT